MVIQEKLKIAAFGAMGAGFVWLATVIGGSGSLLNQALSEIKSARTEIASATTDIGFARVNIDSAQKVLAVLYSAAETTKKDLEILRGQREKINSEILNTIATSKQNINRLGTSIQEVLREQDQTINALDSVNIRTLIIVPAKNKKQ